MKPQHLFVELKRRNIYKVAVAYGIVGWLLIQVAASIFPILEIPLWGAKLVIAMVLLGFPIALVLAWAFELTPEGIKRTQEVAPHKSIRHQTGRKLIGLIAVLAVITGGYLSFHSLKPKPAKTSNSSRSISAPVPRPSAVPIPDKSIAVLPFESLSEDKSNAYFAEGIQDEILTRLSKVSDLKVISRTSTMQFQSAPQDLPHIAQQLGVAHILEGSVQKSADTVRVNVQLIQAPTDSHVWADIYDRKLTDIFAVESDIAKTIAGTLQAKLTAPELTAIAKSPTPDQQAYELYLKGRFFWNKRTGTNLRKAIEYYEQSVAKDPNYALAYVGIADAYSLLPNYGAASPHEAIPQARSAANKALQLDDTLGEAHASCARLLCYDYDFARSTAEFERAIELNPNYAMAQHWLSSGPLMGLGDFDRAIAAGKRAIELDPLSLINNADLGWVYCCARRYNEAIAQARKTLEMDPRFYLARYYLGHALQFNGQLAEATAEYQKAAETDDDPVVLALLGQAYARSGQKDKAQTVLTRLTEEAKSRYVSAYSFAILYLGLREKDRAIAELERGYREGAGDDLFLIKVDPMLDDLRGEARFEALVKTIVAPKL
jgi:TolB-like protein/Tfp pilus assembly protein PilF